jgi:hypothetical protein
MRHNRFTLMFGERILLRHPALLPATAPARPVVPRLPYLQIPVWLSQRWNGVAPGLHQQWVASACRIDGHLHHVRVAVAHNEVLARWRMLGWLQRTSTGLRCLMLRPDARFVTRAQRRHRVARTGLRRPRDELAQAIVQLARQAQHVVLTGLHNGRCLGLSPDPAIVPRV